MNDNTPNATQPLGGLGQRIRTLRRRSGQTIAELADASGVGADVISQLEDGAPPADLELGHLAALLRACGASLQDLGGRRSRRTADRDADGSARRDVEALLRTIERLQERIDALERELDEAEFDTLRAFQVQSIKLLERTMESAGLTRDDMRRLMSDMPMEDVS